MTPTWTVETDWSDCGHDYACSCKSIEYPIALLDEDGNRRAEFTEHATPDDARLIAAAPDLLAALREARSSLEDVDWDDYSMPSVEKLMKQCDDAIAKAEGQQP